MDKVNKFIAELQKATKTRNLKDLKKISMELYEYVIAKNAFAALVTEVEEWGKASNKQIAERFEKKRIEYEKRQAP